MNAQQQELNIRIATEVLRYTWFSFPVIPNLQRPGPNGTEVLFNLPNYCGRIEDAWLIVEELLKRGIRVYNMECNDNHWYLDFEYGDGFSVTEMGSSGKQPTAPLAIVYAALYICAKLRGNNET
jgi:hypothetical protein